MLYNSDLPYSTRVEGNFLEVTLRIPLDHVMPRNMWDHFFETRPPVAEKMAVAQIEINKIEYQRKIAVALAHFDECGSVREASRRSGVLANTIRENLHARDVQANKSKRLALKVEARALYASGLSLKDIALKLGRSHESVRLWLKAC